MADQTQVDMLKKSVKEWNEWREKNPDIQPDLSGADLSVASLNGANLSGADLSVAGLCWARLIQANLSGADLSGADLSVAGLLWADLSRAFLGGANLSGAFLGGANLNDADVSGVTYLERKYVQITSRWNMYKASKQKQKINTLISLLLNTKLEQFLTWVYPHLIMRGKYQGIRVASCYGNAIFKRDAEDQDFLDTLEDQWKHTWWRIKLFWAWRLIDYGRSMLSVFLIAALIITGFGLIYYFNPDMIFYGSHLKTGFTPFYFSIVTFTTLGFGDVTAKGVLGEVIVCFEVVLGYLTLGLLISILANKVARRS